jgi:thiol-disulfide isomerase/thioredoxin
MAAMNRYRLQLAGRADWGRLRPHPQAVQTDLQKKCPHYLLVISKGEYRVKRYLFILIISLIVVVPVLAQNTGKGVMKLEGQIVCCEDCWAKADRKTVIYGTLADIEAAKQCIANGDPSLLAVTSDKGETDFYQLVPNKYKREGANWLAYIGKRVAVTGETGRKKDKQFIKVDELSVIAPAVAEQELASSANIVGTEVPLNLKDLFGVEQNLNSYRGRIVILNFWATYCVPCRQEMPDLAAVQNEYAALGVQVIGAAADTVEDREKVLKFIKETKLNFPVWVGASATDMLRFGLGSALPATVIIGRDGKVISQFRGVINQRDLKKKLDTLLASDARQNKEQIASTKKKSDQASSVPS